MKVKKRILTAQTIQITIAAIGCCILGSYPGMTNNLLSGLRNILEYHKKLTKAVKLVIIFFAILLTACFNDIGFVGWLPTLACALFTMFMSTEKVVALKILIIGSNLLWTIHDFYIMAYTAMVFDILYILANIISIINIKKASTSK